MIQCALKGFGAGAIFDGGAGTDKIKFGEGTYTINGTTINGVMNVTGFEFIGGTSNIGNPFAFANDTLTVDNTGYTTFVAA
jgi:hypothetical protein